MKATGPTPLRLLLASFLGLILLGTCLLKFPFATPPERPIGWIDALFTATSATCVTGLIVRDTGSEFTLFGQLVILGLIQTGGLGVMTFFLFILGSRRGKLSLASRSILEQTLAGAGGWREVRPLLRLVFRFTLSVEAIGALFLFAHWYPALGPGPAAYAGAFHAVSAFCNAGFSTFATSLAHYRQDTFVNLTVAGLIILGGLGFFTLHELQMARRDLRRVSVHVKLALAVTGCLIAVGTGLIWLLEGRNTLRGLPWEDQLLASFFQSVTTRTAGFNTLDIGALAPATLFVMIVLMFVGGSPGSCAGGIKTTTLGVLTMVAWSRLRHRRYVNLFRRTLTPATVGNTLAITVGGFTMVNAGLFSLLLLDAPSVVGPGEQKIFIGYFFETVSALGTVGLSTGVTPELSPAARFLVSLLMFLGRVGPLSAAAALTRPSRVDDWRYPEEDVMVG